MLLVKTLSEEAEWGSSLSPPSPGFVYWSFSRQWLQDDNLKLNFWKEDHFSLYYIIFSLLFVTFIMLITILRFHHEQLTARHVILNMLIPFKYHTRTRKSRYLMIRVRIRALQTRRFNYIFSNQLTISWQSNSTLRCPLAASTFEIIAKYSQTVNCRLTATGFSRWFHTSYSHSRCRTLVLNDSLKSTQMVQRRYSNIIENISRHRTP